MKMNYIINIIIRIIKFIFFIVLSILVYHTLFDTILTKNIHIIAYILLWFYSAYFILPRINRTISKLYLPNYYIGRTKTSDNILGDPINLAFIGNKEDIINLFISSGFEIADKLTLKTSIKITLASVFKKSYKKAPVSSLYLFNNIQDIAFEIQINNNPRIRHHIRLWKTPDNWYLPGGTKADYLAAATFDRKVGISLFTGQVTHKINSDIDEEREYIINLLKNNNLVQDIKVIEHFTSSYHSRNGGGDKIYTDGALPFITVKKYDEL